MNRRQFIGGAFALAGAAAWAGSVRGEPALKVGVLSDVHVSPPDMFKSADAIKKFEDTLAFFKRENVDAVLIAGDLTNDGLVRELQTVADAWKKVFGAIDRGPEKVFVTGNHEIVYYNSAKRKGDFSNPRYADGLYRDVRKNWKAVFGEEWSPLFVKTVKGYSFVGRIGLNGMTKRRFALFLRRTRRSSQTASRFFMFSTPIRRLRVTVHGHGTSRMEDLRTRCLRISRMPSRFPDIPIIRLPTSAAFGKGRSHRSVRAHLGGCRYRQDARTDLSAMARDAG